MTKIINNNNEHKNIYNTDLFRDDDSEQIYAYIRLMNRQRLAFKVTQSNKIYNSDNFNNN